MAPVYPRVFGSHKQFAGFLGPSTSFGYEIVLTMRLRVVPTVVHDVRRGRPPWDLGAGFIVAGRTVNFERACVAGRSHLGGDVGPASTEHILEVVVVLVSISQSGSMGANSSAARAR